MLKRRQSRVRSGSRGNTPREARGHQRYKARLPTPWRAWSRPNVTTSLACRGVLGPGAQRRIDVVDQGGDNLRGGHGLLHASQGCTLLTSVEEVHDQGKVASECY